MYSLNVAGIEDEIKHDIKVAVIDDGIDGFQEDLAETLWLERRSVGTRTLTAL